MRPVTPSRRYEKNREGLPTVHHAGLPSLPYTAATPKARSRWRAKAGKLASHLPAPSGVKHAVASALWCTKAARTWSPTSNAEGPMHGPSHASTPLWAALPGPAFSLGHTASKAPRPSLPANPRQPACTAATRLPSAVHSKTGKQSATNTVQATLALSVHAASARKPSGVPRASVSTSVPCTWSMNTARGGGSDNVCSVTCWAPCKTPWGAPCDAARWTAWDAPCGSVGDGLSAASHPANRTRLSCTRSGVSPTWVPRFICWYGPCDVPPTRVVHSERTLAGAGHWGTRYSTSCDTSWDMPLGRLPVGWAHSL